MTTYSYFKDLIFLTNRIREKKYLAAERKAKKHYYQIHALAFGYLNEID